MKSSVLNQVVNFFWTILCFVPVFTYWMGNKINIWFYVFILFSIAAGCLPGKLFQYFQLSNKPLFYERLGARFVQKFVQDGTYINRLRRNNNESRKVINGLANARAYLSTIDMYERYHFICFIFFDLTFIHALFSTQNRAAVFIMVANIIYNIYPVLLQQYNKLRILRLLNKMH